MRSIILTLSLLIGSIAFAHDEGHGPKLSANENEKAVILAAEVKLGAKAKPLYAATLKNLTPDEVAVYVKSTTGGAEPDFTKFKEEAQGTLKSTSTRKKVAPKTFALKRVTEGGHSFFKGNLPHLGHGLYELEVTLNDGAKDLFVAFPKVEGHSH